MTTTAAGGHRLVSRAADCLIEAWGPDRASCLGQALQGLIEEFAQVSDTPALRALPLSAAAGAPGEMLVSLLEEVIYALEVFSVVPVRVHLCDTEDGGVSGDMEVVPLAAVHVVGPAPRAVSHKRLSMSEDGGSWQCRVLIDV